MTPDEQAELDHAERMVAKFTEQLAGASGPTAKDTARRFLLAWTQYAAQLRQKRSVGGQ
jgi:hypothetical protein